jgi:hypothetical protein
VTTAYNGLSHDALRGLKRDLQNLDRAHQSARGRIKYDIEMIDAALERVSPGAVEVTDHAVVRWLERVEGYDVAAVRRRMANLVFANPGVGQDRVIEFDRGKLVLQDARVVVTVLDLTQRAKGRAKDARFTDSPFAALAGLKFDPPKPADQPAKPTFIERLGKILTAKGAS